MGTKIPTCFNAEVRQFFTTATPNSRGLDNMVQKVPFGPCFPLSSCAYLVQQPKVSHWWYSALSSWITKKFWFSLFCWLEELTAKAWYYLPGYFLPHFVEDISEDNPKPVSNGHMLNESDHPAHLWRNGPKAPGCPLHWDQLCSCQGWRDHTLSRCFNAEVRHCTQRLAPAVQGAAWAHHELLSWVSFCDSSLCWRVEA